MRGFLIAAAVFCASISPALADTSSVEEGELRVGAAKVDITPAPNELPKSYEGIHDPIYARAIVIDNGHTRAALITLDVGGIFTDVWSNVSRKLEKQLDIPVANLMLTATHTHSAPPTLGRIYEDRIVQAAVEAAKRLQPATVAYGTGVSYINVNRNIIDRNTNRWWEGPNYDGPSDKTVAILQFRTMSGEPIAVYYNYAVHAVLMGQSDMISGDIPGAASAYLENSLGGNAVAVWSEGAAGDQNPIYFQQTYDLRKIRIDDYAKRGIDISNAMPPGGEGLDKSNPEVIKLMKQQEQMTFSMGQMLAEEVLHVMRENSERPFQKAAIHGAQSTVMCPGRNRTDKGRAGYPGQYTDADPIPIGLSLLKFGDVVIGGVNGEVFTMIAQRYKRESPYKHTMMATLTNGSAPSGYIPNDAAFGYNTFEVVSSHLKPGCAESAIVNGLLDLAD